MPHVEEELSEFLLNQTAITDIVETRVFAMRIPQLQELPAVSFRMSSKKREAIIDRNDGTVEGILEVDAVAYKAKEVLDLADAIREALDGQDESTFADPLIHEINLETETQIFEPFPEGSDKAIYHVSLEFVVQYIG